MEGVCGGATQSKHSTPVFEKDTRISPSTNAHGSLDYVDVLKNLGLTILAPLVVGQLIQWQFPRQVAAIKDKCRLGDINSLALLALVWSVFSDAIASNSFSAVGATDIVAIVIINAGFYISWSLLCLTVARLPLPRCIKTPEWVRRLRYSRADTVAIMVSFIPSWHWNPFETDCSFVYIVVLWCNKDRRYGCPIGQCSLPRCPCWYCRCLDYSTFALPC